MAASFERLDPKEQGTNILYQTADGQTSLDVRLQEETVWLSLTQMAELLDRDKSEISGISGTSFGKGNWSERQLLQKMQQLPQTAKRIRWNFSTWMRSSPSATGSTPSAAPSPHLDLVGIQGVSGQGLCPQSAATDRKRRG